MGLWGPLDPRELLVCTPSDPYANVYEKGDIASIIARGQVRCGEEQRLVVEAFQLLGDELGYLIEVFMARGVVPSADPKSKPPLHPHDAEISL